MGKRTEIVKGISFAKKASESESDVDIDALEEEDEEVSPEEPPQVEKKTKKAVVQDNFEEDEVNPLTKAERKEKKRKQQEALAAAEEEGVDEVNPLTKAERKAKKRKQEEAVAAAAEGEHDEAAARKEKIRKQREAMAAADEAEYDDVNPMTKAEKKENKRKQEEALELKKSQHKVEKEDDEVLEEAEPGLGKKKRKKLKREALALAAAAEPEEDAASKRRREFEAEMEEEAKAESRQDSSGADKKILTVYVSGIPWGVKEAKLREDFSKGGRIKDLNAPMNEQGKPRGIAFITYLTKEGVDGALTLDGLEYGGRTLSVKLADKAKTAASKGAGKGKGKDKGNKAFEVWICGLPFETEKDVLTKDFAECGEIANLNMLVKSDGSCRGVAFVTYRTLEAAQKACEFNGTEYGGRWIQVELSGESRGAKGKGKGK